MKNVYINKGQKLDEIWAEIPSNKIIFKNITGIGATTLEIACLRHSIIIEPNVPVIKGKLLKHPYVLGVYRGVNEKHILDYLRNESILFKKIITTPESFEKIFMSTLLESDFDMRFIYNNFFLLFDECDKITKDVGFREDITIPMNRFFDFKNKSFISATALIPSDPRFRENNFEFISIVPTYDISVDIEIITSNNIYSVLEELLDTQDPKKNFIFFNSLKGIEKVISILKIKESSAVFCSDKALTNVDDRVKYSSSMISEENFQNFNFFTSRFFSAVDIDINYDCNIFLITDTEMASYTTIDPNSEAIQIIGRFRNTDIQKKIRVLSDVNKKFKDNDLLNIDRDVKIIECTFNQIKRYRNATKFGSSDYLSFTRILNSTIFNEYLDSNGNKSYFKIDNKILENSVLSKFQNEETLIRYYSTCKIIDSDLNYFNVVHIHQSKFFDAKTTIHRKVFVTYREYLKRILKVYCKFQEIDEMDINYDEMIVFLKEAELYYPEIIEAIRLDLIENLYICYDKADVLKLVKLTKLENDKTCIPFLEELRIYFPKECVIEVTEFKTIFKRIIDKYNLSIPATARQAGDFLKISDRFRGRGIERDKYFYRIEGHL
ncbi:DEAD/DEAH box helicase family protein [Sphingobacterium mizutaii]|uniref:DEAD/DEAH box helicase family protein n=1 Tax=Sphingobacterium mizutaii TaxID=1010 RepID=UPI0016259DEF|nr:DEAD/DEAH box helicase family protein [Sphingobacterium mizutaii]